MTIQLFDAADVAGVRLTADGYLVADARIARTGVQVYSGAEVGKPELASVRIFRPDDEVFSADAMASLAHRPVTNDHPPESVKAANWKRFAVGMTGDTVTKDGGFIRVPLTLMDQAAIDALKGGKRELSVGYVCALDWTAGATPDGQAYDAIQRGIRANHLALVDKARAGHDCRIGDRGSLPAKQGKATMTDRKITVDGFTFDASEQAAQAITKLETKVADASKALNDANEAHAKALAAKDADIAKKDAEIDALKKAAISDAEIDKRVAARADLVSTAKAIASDVKTDGLSDAAIRKATVIAKLGDAAIKDKSDAYIDARFDILAEDAKTAKKPDPLAAAAKAAMGDKAAGGGDPQAMRDGAYHEYVNSLNGKKKEAA